MKFIYKIRRKSDDLFSTGGMNPSFSTFGKTWNCRKNLKSHLALVIKKEENYKDCEIVEYRVEEIGAYSI